MDGTSVAIVLLFVFAIFSSVSDKTSTNLPSGVYGARSGLFESVLNKQDLPPANFSVAPGQNLEDNIRTFIQSYAKPTDRVFATQIAAEIMHYSEEYDVNPRLMTALMARESRFNPQAVSSHGALGLGQLLPSTAASLGVDDAYAIDQNVRGSTRYMKYLLDKWKQEEMQVPLALASYLAGPNAISQTTGLSNSTMGYISDILKIYNRI